MAQTEFPIALDITQTAFQATTLDFYSFITSRDDSSCAISQCYLQDSAGGTLDAGI